MGMLRMIADTKTNLKLPTRRGRGRPRRRFIDSVNYDVLARGLNWDEGTICLAQNRAGRVATGRPS